MELSWLLFQRPQTLAVHLKPTDGEGREVYVGWTGMASASSLASFNSTAGERGIETLEIDPQYAAGLGFKEGDVVRSLFPRTAIPSSG